MSIESASPDLARRSFLVGSLGGGLVMAFGGILAPASAQAALETGSFAPTVWFEMAADGATTVHIAKAEMGQHVGTALARIVADELGVAWQDVSISHVDSDPRWGYMVTGGSWSVFTSFAQLSQAGAAGRLALVQAGAAMLGVEVGQCTAVSSEVRCGDQAVSYAQIVTGGNIDRTFTAEQLAELPIKAPAERQLIGRATAALDIPEKTRGSAVYGIDAQRPGMVYARPLVPPTRFGSVVQSVDDSQAKGVAGFQGHQVLKDPSNTLQGWVVALADTYWGAVQAADAIKVQWDAGPTAKVAEEDLLIAGRALTADHTVGGVLVDDGDVVAARAAASDQLSAVYTTATALHFTLEPANAIAEQVDGHWHVYTGNQWQSLILPVLATALEVPEARITLHQHYLGGGFGRRLYGDYILPAALASKAIGKPVKVIFQRDDDSRFDCVRSPSVQRFEASLDSAGELTGLEHAAAAGWPTLGMAPGFLADGKNGSGKVDPFSISGADHWYNLPAHRVRAINNELAQQTFMPGWLRAVGPGWVAWGVESFMDELAHKAGQDPLAYRLGRLDATGKNAGTSPNSVGGAGRLANVLERVKEKSNWGRDMPADSGQGVAVASGQERNMPTWVAVVAEVSVNRSSGEVKVDCLHMVIDCGTVVHPDGAMAQAEGAALWGVSLALHEGTRFVDGQVVDRNLDTYTPLRMADVPELSIEFVDSTEFPVGMGEPPLIAVAPAIGNAIHAAVGIRLRDLPMRPAAVKAALG